LVSDIEEGKQSAEENISTEERLTGGWIKLHDEENHNLYSSPSIIRMIKYRRMK
jgi:hypothetical protein